MIRRLLVGSARALFQLAAVCLVLAGLLGYAAYRLARRAWVDEPTRPLNEALFALVLAADGVRRSLGVRLPTPVPGPPDDPG